MPTMARRSALARVLRGSAEACLVTKPVNVRYLTGFSGSTGAALVAPDGSVVLATDGRYEERARREAPDAELLVTRDAAADLLRRAAGAGLATVAVEEHHLS